MAYCGDAGFAGYGYGGHCGPAFDACAPAPCGPVMEHCAPVMEHYAPALAPAVAPVGHTSVEAWGRPVYKKKWLLGKWKYAGMSDVKYVPRSHTDFVPTAVPTLAAAPCAPAACYGGYDAGCGPCF
eukprot:NODE_5226_length_722_cov_268.852897_g4396_i0.p3 GENE.NODE_5226_length_722_cov_268.852897_g4396_i0~~NODE_5226_length_722_cov_268.852897_g4396_i0.p3  ORF type:complete len:126 (+),score=12.16 NODE_5226_length_722_cov_268.852897_g4396_i0:203-580(+)